MRVEGTRIALMKNAPTRYVTPSHPSAQPGPTAATSSPPTAAPAMFVPENVKRSSAFASCS